MLFKTLLSIVLLILTVFKWRVGRKKRQLEHQVSSFKHQESISENLLARGRIGDYEERKALHTRYEEQLKKVTYLAEGIDEYLVWLGIVVSTLTIAFSLYDSIVKQ